MFPSFSDYLEIKSDFGEKSVDYFFQEILEGKIIEGEPSDEEITKAIQNRNLVGIYYEDVGAGGKVLSGFRLIEPYAFGYGLTISKDSEEKRYLRAFVIKDTRTDTDRKGRKHKMKRRSVSKTGREPYWRMLRVDRIKTWERMDKVFSQAREDYNPDDKHIARIVSKIDPEAFPYT